MKTQISFHNFDNATHEGLENTIRELARGHVERYLSRFPPDAAELQVNLEKSRHRIYYRVTMQLFLPGGSLSAHNEDYDLRAALHRSFEELEREVLRHVSRLRQEDAWRRKEQPDELRRLKTAIDASPPPVAEAFVDQVRAQLPKLQRFAERELSALRARGDLNPGEPTPQEIIDEVLARAYKRQDERPQDLDLLHWLYQLTHEVLDEEARKRRKERQRDYTLDEQDRGVFEFWQPDEMLKPKDVVPVTDVTPEEIVSDEEFRKYFHDVLSKMPNNWRRAIWLTQAEGISVSKAARMMGVSEAELKRWIQQGDEYLRAQLKEAGYTPGEEGKLPVTYFVPTEANETPELAEAFDNVTKGAK